jgi:hypothetical protein
LNQLHDGKEGIGAGGRFASLTILLGEMIYNQLNRQFLLICRGVINFRIKVSN